MAKKKNFVADFIAAVKASKNADGESHISSKQLAKLIKFKLGEKFPGVKFSVTSDHNSIDVGYDNGPPSSVVNGFIDQFSFGGFDGMIDMAYSSKNWLLLDGSMTGASSTGTEGSMGVHAAFQTDCPEPGASLVSSYVKYVNAQNHLSDDYWNLLCKACAAKFELEIDDWSIRDVYVESQDCMFYSLVWKFYKQVWVDGGDKAYEDPAGYVRSQCQSILAMVAVEEFLAEDQQEQDMFDFPEAYLF